MFRKITTSFFSRLSMAVCFFLLLSSTESLAQPWNPVGLPNSTRTSDVMIQNVSSAVHTNGDLYIAYHGQYTSVYVRKLNRATGIWENVLSSFGIPSGGGAITTAIAITKDGVPIVAIKQYASPYNIQLYKPGTMHWEALGGFPHYLYSQYDGKRISMALDNNDVPYIMYQTFEGYISIKKLVNNTWENVGDQNLGLRNGTDHISLAIDRSNVPFICYTSKYGAYDKEVNVLKLVGNTWQSISSQLLLGNTTDVIFGLDSQSTPYLGMQHLLNGFLLKRLQPNQNWVDAAPAFNGINSNAVMRIDKNDNIYISGKENQYIPRLSVAKLNKQANRLEFVGTPNFTGPTSENAMVIDNNGKVTLICTDRNVRPTMSTRTYNPNNNTWEIIDNPGVDATRTERFITVTDRSRIPHIAYAEKTGRKAAVRKHNGTAWVNVGTEGFSSGTAEGISMAFDGQGVPFVCFADGDHGKKATVMSYHQATNSWQVYGDAGFSAGGVKDPYLKVNNNNEMFITYIDETHGNRITSMKYNASTQTWEALGAEGFSTGAKSIATDFDKQGNPVIVYITEQDKIRTVRWDNGIWTNVGTGNATTSSAAYPSIAVDQNNHVFVGFKNLDDNKAMVSKNTIVAENMGFNKSGPEWVSLGEVEENNQDASSISIVVDGNGTPYIAYVEKTENSKVVVKRFHNNNWSLLGEQTRLSSGDVEQVSLTISETGELYTTYNANGIFMQSFDTSVLPIRLSSFTAHKNANNVALNWQTQMEQDNKGFDIKRSTDGVTFSRIGFVAGKNMPSNYSFIDKQPRAGINYYRLKQVDNNGDFSHSETVVVNFELKQTDVSVYPNPASNFINLVNIGKEKSATIYDVSGRKIKEAAITDQKIEISDLKPGVYFLSVAGKKLKFIKS